MTAEPKFGQNKQFVSFADLAMKSKSHLPGMDFKVKPVVVEKRERLPPKRQRVAARLSLEQSSIEDTPVLAALQAAKEDAQPAVQPTTNNGDSITELTYVHEKGHHHGAQVQPEDVEDYEEPAIPEELSGSLRLLVGEHATEEEKSRATRSRLHVDTIGLNSSTLGMALQKGKISQEQFLVKNTTFFFVDVTLCHVKRQVII